MTLGLKGALVGALALAGTSLTAVDVEAMPVQPLASVAAAPDSGVQQVWWRYGYRRPFFRYGYGYGFRRPFWGYRRFGYPVYRRYGYRRWW